MPKIVQSLDQYGLHLAFLDPYNLGTLSFDLFVELAKLKRIDVIAHVSLSDLQRNADRYTSEAYDEFDKFAPGWRENVSTDMNQNASRRAYPILVRQNLGAWPSSGKTLGVDNGRSRSAALLVDPPCEKRPCS